METLKAFILLSVLFTLSSCALKPEKKKEDASASIHYKMAEVHFSEKNYTSALSELTKAVELAPRNAIAYSSLGQAYDKLNMTDDAVDAYRKAISIEPLFTNAYHNLGMALLKKKDKAGALKAFEKVVEIDPGSDKARSAREYIELLK